MRCPRRQEHARDLEARPAHLQPHDEALHPKCQLASACIKKAKSGKPRRFFSFDVTQVYLKGDDTEAELMYVRPPQGYRTYDKSGTPLVWRLNTPLYGQGDAGRIWYKTMLWQLLLQGFVQSHGDPCLYV